MTIFTRRVITKDSRRTCLPCSSWEAWGIAGKKYHGRSQAEAVGLCILKSPEFGTSATIEVREEPTYDLRKVVSL